MRTVIFFGLITISDAIAVQTGYKPSDTVATVGAFIFLASIGMDIADFVKGALK